MIEEITMQHLLFSIENNVGTITINRPDRANSLQTDVKDELTKLLRDIKHNDEVRVIIITGAGKSFCSGGDLSTMGTNQNCVQGRERMRLSAEWVYELIDMEKPSIAAVNGAAVGAGVGLATACDFIIAADTAKLICGFSNLSLVPDGAAMYFIPRRIGIAKAKLFAYEGKPMTGSEAEGIGLVDKALPLPELMPYVKEFAKRLAARPTYALGMTKKMINSSFETEFYTFMERECNWQAIAFQTSDHMAAIEAINRKSTVDFKGK